MAIQVEREKLEKLQALNNDLAYELSDFAKHAAIKALLHNWDAAINDGELLRSLLTDVDDLIEALYLFKGRALKIAIEEPSHV